jgi:hypothetical protein
MRTWLPRKPRRAMIFRICSTSNAMGLVLEVNVRYPAQRQEPQAKLVEQAVVDAPADVANKDRRIDRPGMPSR